MTALFVCLSAVSKITQKRYEWILMKCSVNIDNRPKKSSFNFGNVPDSRWILTSDHKVTYLCNLILLPAIYIYTHTHYSTVVSHNKGFFF